ncbi:MAG: M56 family metallopeptidase [Chitinophagaceae bacterium]
MPFLFQYLLKFSLSLALLYTFYFIVLRPLTFYQWNRFYLLCYSLLSFIIPFINITQWLPKENREADNFINSIPAVENLAYHSSISKAAVVLNPAVIWNLTALFFLTGASIMLIRVMYQYISLKMMKRKAVLLKTGDFEFYDVDGPISPFSFANAIFINSRLHTEEEFRRILEHEFVHVKQKHTIDIVLAEMICIFNWFNPFAWLIRKAIRQNLEFIADNNVLEGGIDPRQYQYLLLKVMGLSQYRIANNFSISSLKKRIAMMNKMKSARLHLVKFMFVLPMLVLMLLAFRNKMSFKKDGLMLTYAGIVINSENDQPLKNIWIRELNTKTEILTDANGYFKIRVPVKDNSTTLRVNILKEGFLKKEMTIKWVEFEPKGSESFIGLVSINNELSETGNCDKCFVHNDDALDENGLFVEDLSYEMVNRKVSDFINVRADLETITNSDKPIIRTGNKLYILGGSFPRKLSKDAAGMSFSLLSLPIEKEDPVIYLNRFPTTIENVNSTTSRYEIKQVDHLKKETAIKKYGKDKDVIDIITYSGVGFDTVPRKPVPPEAPVKVQVENVPAAPVPPVLAAPSIQPKKSKKTPPAAPVTPPSAPVPSPLAPPLPSIAPTDTAPRTLIRIINKTGSGEPLYIVDGKVLPKGMDLKGISPDSIESINVIKGNNAIALHGEQAANGVVQVNTKHRISSDDMVSVSAARVNLMNVKDVKALIIVDGVETSKAKFSELDPGSIQSISVLKGASATQLYKEKGKDGVIIVTTKPSL